MAGHEPTAESVALLEKLVAALKRKGIATEEDIAIRRTSAERANPETGARMVAKAWTDPAFLELMRRDGTAAVESMGISMRGNPPLGILEDTAQVHHLVVCTLCSCYPWPVLGLPPVWYKSAPYRSRAVIDPRGVLLNQAWLRWRPDPRFEVTAGRQAVNYDNQRWIGSVGWRQNDQTLDAVRLATKPFGALTLDYMHAWRVNRVFGPDSAQGIWRDNQIDALRLGYTIKNVGTISGYGYWLDIPSSPANSSRTLGVRIAGEHKVGGKSSLLYAAEYARQQPFGANPNSFGLDYWLIEPGVKFGSVTLKGGYEQLEGNGAVGLQTPLATLHAFNGWADKFLTTPANGLRDIYIDAGYKVPGKGPLAGLTLRAMWHDYNSTRLGLNYGSEWDAQVSYPLTKQIGLTAKVARYNADAFATDTTKFWFQIEAKF